MEHLPFSAQSPQQRMARSGLPPLVAGIPEVQDCTDSMGKPGRAPLKTACRQRNFFPAAAPDGSLWLTTFCYGVARLDSKGH